MATKVDKHSNQNGDNSSRYLALNILELNSRVMKIWCIVSTWNLLLFSPWSGFSDIEKIVQSQINEGNVAGLLGLQRQIAKATGTGNIESWCFIFSLNN